MHPFKTKLFIICLMSLTILLGNNPPEKGHRFPKGYWTIIRNNPDILDYSPTAWTHRMEQRRQVRMEMALNKRSKVRLDTAKFSLPVIIANYSDTQLSYKVADFDSLLFGNNKQGNLTDYFKEVSYDQFVVTGSVYGPFTAGNTKSYYTSDNNGSNSNYPANSKGFVRSIIEAADAAIDFTKYDNDGPDGIPNSGDDDGYVDAVCIVYQGSGTDERATTGTNLWPHKSSLGSSNEYTSHEGIIVSNYFVAPEKHANGGIRAIGVFAHEFGHIIGLPDLYDRTDDTEGPDYDDSNGIGEWGLMASGSWGGDGKHSYKPSHLTAWSKIQMGWITPTILLSDQKNLKVKESKSNPEAYLLWEDGFTGARYFLIENRQKKGFDTYLNGAGLMIYHVDQNRSWGSYKYNSGPNNNDENRKLIDVEAADGAGHMDLHENRGDAGDPWPGTSVNRNFWDNSNPNSKDYDDKSTYVKVINISDSGDEMTADIEIRDNVGYMIAYDEQGISGWGWGSSTAKDYWGGVRFTAPSPGLLSGIDIGFRRDNYAVEIQVFEKFKSFKTENLILTMKDSITERGWHSYSFPSEPKIVLREGSDIFISYKVINQTYPISFDKFGETTYRSYSSTNGLNWSASIGSSGDINIRARMDTVSIDLAVEDEIILPEYFTLKQNYPNPFNPKTTLIYMVGEEGIGQLIRLNIYDIQGRLVETLADQTAKPGIHQITWNGGQYASGVYLAKLESAQSTQVIKMVLMK